MVDSHTGVAIASWLAAVLRRKDLSRDATSLLDLSMFTAMVLKNASHCHWYDCCCTLPNCLKWW